MYRKFLLAILFMLPAVSLAHAPGETIQYDLLLTGYIQLSKDTKTFVVPGAATAMGKFGKAYIITCMIDYGEGEFASLYYDEPNEIFDYDTGLNFKGGPMSAGFTRTFPSDGPVGKELATNGKLKVTLSLISYHFNEQGVKVYTSVDSSSGWVTFPP